MITEERVMALLAESNPVPDIAALDLSEEFPSTHLTDLNTRSTEMTQYRSRGSTTGPVRGRRRLIVGMAAAAAIVIAAAVLWRPTEEAPVGAQTSSATTTNSTDPSIATVPSAIDVANRFLAAYWGRFDADLAFSYLADDPESFGFGTMAEERLMATFRQETGSGLVNARCEQLNASPDGTVVRCTHDRHEFFSDVLGLGPYGPNTDDFTIDSGKIVSMERRGGGFSPFFNQIWSPFADWIGAKHPDDRAVLYDPYPTTWRITEDSIPVWAQRLRQYVDEVVGATRGYVGLPPESAAPSTPVDGELVASMWEHVSALGTFGDGWMYLFEDGRLVWARYEDRGTPLLEQRLSPEGVELIRSEIMATGLFDSSQSPVSTSSFSGSGRIAVRVGDQLVVHGFDRDLFARLATLWTWLPESAWEDQEATAYIASRYGVCAQTGGVTLPVNPSQYLSELPAAARDMLGAARQIHLSAVATIDPTSVVGTEYQDDDRYCFELSAEETHALAGILEDAGFEMWWYPGAYEISSGVVLALAPILPHGSPFLPGG